MGTPKLFFFPSVLDSSRKKDPDVENRSLLRSSQAEIYAFEHLDSLKKFGVPQNFFFSVLDSSRKKDVDVENRSLLRSSQAEIYAFEHLGSLKNSATSKFKGYPNLQTRISRPRIDVESSGFRHLDYFFERNSKLKKNFF